MCVRDRSFSLFFSNRLFFFDTFLNDIVKIDNFFLFNLFCFLFIVFHITKRTAGIGKHDSKVIVDSDRKSAIRKALETAQKGDVVVLAGKGQETYQILANGKIHFDEREVVAEILSEKAGK